MSVTSPLRLAQRMSCIAPSPMLKLATHANALRAAGADVISLATGEPDFDTPVHIQEAAIAAIRAGDTHYTAADGTAALKQAVCRKFERENGLKFTPSQITIGVGAKQVLFNALAATVDAGDEVIVPLPCYPAYLDLVRMQGGVVVGAQTSAKTGFRLQPADLEAAITPKTRWLILNSPSNPTGSVLSADDLAALAEVLRRHPHVWVMCDDMYEHLFFAKGKFATLAAVAPDLADRVLTVNGVSKAYCMTGWRIGYGAGPEALIKAMGVVCGQAVSCPPSVSQAAAIAALDGPDDVVRSLCATFRIRRDLVTAALNAISGIHCPLPEGAFYVFPDCSALIGKTTPEGQTITSDTALSTWLLEETGVALVPGSDFSAPGHFRISYAASTEQLTDACARIARAVATLV